MSKKRAGNERSLASTWARKHAHTHTQATGRLFRCEWRRSGWKEEGIVEERGQNQCDECA